MPVLPLLMECLPEPRILLICSKVFGPTASETGLGPQLLWEQFIASFQSLELELS